MPMKSRCISNTLIAATVRNCGYETPSPIRTPGEARKAGSRGRELAQLSEPHRKSDFNRDQICRQDAGDPLQSRKHPG